MTFFKAQGRALLLAAALAAAVCTAGCGGGKDAPPQGKPERSAESGKPEQAAESGKSEKKAASVNYGKLADGRDGYEYKTVKIGGQTWTAENIRFDAEGSWCYGNSADSCGKYGKLYDWKTAMTVCPKGWHLPSVKEWEELRAAVGPMTSSKELRSASGWSNNYNGKDTYGFSALPGGYRYSDGTFRSAGRTSRWWTSGGIGDNSAYIMYTDYDHDIVYMVMTDKIASYSVRCVED